jgi:hypothetical protein
MDNMSTMSDFKDKVESGQFDRERDEFRENMYKELIEQRDSIISMLLESHPDLNIQPILNLEGSDLMFWIAEVIFPRDPETEEVLSPFVDDDRERINELYRTRGIRLPEGCI